LPGNKIEGLPDCPISVWADAAFAHPKFSCGQKIFFEKRLIING
jgi:hypothetical protein